MPWNFDGTCRERYVFRERPVEEKESESATWSRVAAVLMRVLPRFPEARAAVVMALKEAFSLASEPAPQWAT